jgi:hypothetical protein
VQGHLTVSVLRLGISVPADTDQGVRVEEVVAERLAEQPAHGGLAAAHHAHQVQAGAAQLLLHRLRRLLVCRMHTLCQMAKFNASVWPRLSS